MEWVYSLVGTSILGTWPRFDFARRDRSKENRPGASFEEGR